jgi:hypothetical protein
MNEDPLAHWGLLHQKKDDVGQIHEQNKVIKNFQCYYNSAVRHRIENVKFVNAQQAKQIYQFRNNFVHLWA